MKPRVQVKSSGCIRDRNYLNLSCHYVIWSLMKVEQIYLKRRQLDGTNNNLTLFWMDEKRLTWLLRRSDCTTALSSWDFSPCLCGLSVYESFATCALSSLNWVSRMPFQSWIVETIIGEMRLYRRLNFSQLFCFTNGCCSPRVSRSYYWRDENLQTSNIPWHEWSSHSMDRARFTLVECLAEEVKLDPSKTSLLTQLKSKRRFNWRREIAREVEVFSTCTLIGTVEGYWGLACAIYVAVSRHRGSEYWVVWTWKCFFYSQLRVWYYSKLP